MKGYLLVAGVLGLGLITTVSAPAFAHHSNAAYSDEVTEFQQATITKFAWANPHSVIYFDVTDTDGNVVHWVAETAAPQALRLIGWTKTTLMPGDVITVRLYAARNGNPAGRLNKIVFADGTELHDTQLGGDEGGKSRYDPHGFRD
jgi:Family of unknown function (DUF6152)